MAHNNITVNSREPLSSAKINCTLSPIILIGRNKTQAYDTNSDSPTLNVGDKLYIYDPEPINNIKDASITTVNGWVSGFTLPAGTYIMEMSFSMVFSASGSIQYGFREGLNYQGSIASCGGLTNVYLSGGGVSVNVKTLTVSTDYTFRIFSKSNLESVANQGDTPSEQSWVLIEKIS